MHRALERQASKKGLKGERRDAFIFGALANAKKKKPKK